MEALAAFPGAWLRGSVIAYACVNAAHILGLGLLIGAVTALDLRLLGAFRQVPLGPLADMLARIAGVGLGIALLTGLLLFSVRPQAYLANPAFLAKLALVGAGLLNVAVLRASRAWRPLRAGAAPGRAVKAGALLSLACWIGAVLAGRWIGFVE